MHFYSCESQAVSSACPEAWRGHAEVLAALCDGDARFEALFAYAHASCEPSAEAAVGLCLHASVCLARKAVELGVECGVSFIYWRVLNDRSFYDHWAISLGGGCVLDMTSVQIDGRAGPFRQIADYPANYLLGGEYPVRNILDHLDPALTTSAGKYSERTMLGVVFSMARHDCAAAVRSSSPRRLLRAMSWTAKATLGIGTNYLLYKAVSRTKVLRARLEGEGRPLI
jgi:hypothetical protein